MKRIEKLNKFPLYVLLFALVGCGKPNSASEPAPTACSAEVVEDHNNYESAKNRSDFSAIANYCAKFLSKHGTQSCQKKSANGQTTTISYGGIESTCQEAQSKSRAPQSFDEGLSIGGFQNSCTRDTLETYNRTLASLKALDELGLSLPSDSKPNGNVDSALLVAAKSCEQARVVFKSPVACVANIDSQLEWISFRDLDVRCQTVGEQLEISQRVARIIVNEESEAAGLVSGPNTIRSLRGPIKLMVRDGRVLTSMFAAKSEDMDVFVSRGQTFGRAMVVNEIRADHLICGVTRDKINLILKNDDSYISSKITIRSYSDRTSWKRSIVRFENSEGDIFWISCIGKAEATLAKISRAFSGLLDLQEDGQKPIQ